MNPPTSRSLFRPILILRLAFALSPVAAGPARAQVSGQVSALGVIRGAESVTLQWQGGHGPYVVECLLPGGRWSAQGDPFVGTPAVLPGFASGGIYRIVDLDADGRHGGAFGLVQTDQGEFGPLFGRHRLKTRLWFFKTQEPPHTSPTFTAAEYFRKLIVVRQFLDQGAVRTWTGPLEALGTVATPTSSRLTVAWSAGTGAGHRSFVLSLSFPYTVGGTRTAAPLASDPRYELACTYTSPQPEIDYGANGLEMTNTLTDGTALYQLDPENPNAPFPAERKYTVNDRGAQVSLHFREGLPLIEGSPPFIWKTFILDRWISPTTAGGGSLPAFSTDSWFARTLKPGHHNFVETVLIEPALDPALSESTRAALQAANIRFLYTFKDLDLLSSPDDVRYVGFDDTLRNP